MHSWARGMRARPRADRGRHGRRRLRALDEADDRPPRPALARRRRPARDGGAEGAGRRPPGHRLVLVRLGLIRARARRLRAPTRPRRPCGPAAALGCGDRLGAGRARARRPRFPALGWWPTVFVAVADGARRPHRPARVERAARRVRVRRGLLPRERLVHGPVPRPRAVARPVDARSRHHGGVRRARSPSPTAGCRARSPGAGRASSCCRCWSPGSGRCASRWSGSWPYGGFPWGRVGVTQSTSILGHLASWVGISGLTFLIVLCCAAGIEFVRLRQFRSIRVRAPDRRRRAAPAARAAVPDDGCRHHPRRRGAGQRTAGYFDERAPHAVLDAQLEATKPLVGQDMDVLLWPEGGIDSDPTTDARTAAVLDDLARADRRTAARERGDHPRRGVLQLVAAVGRGCRQPDADLRQVASGALRGVRPRSLVLQPARAGPHRTDRARLHPGQLLAVLRCRRRRGGTRDLLRRHLRRRHLGGRARRRRGLHVPDEQRRLPRHRREPAAAGVRPDARDRDRAERW